MLSEAPIPDQGIYSYPALAANGPGLWWFGLFIEPNGLAEHLLAGKAKSWVTHVKNDAVDQKTKLTMPVMAIGASNSLGRSVPNQVRQYATHVTSIVFPDSGHWIYEEHPAESTQLLLRFLR